MGHRTYRIELKVDFDDDTRHDAITAIGKQLARDWRAAALLTSDGTRKPQIAFFSNDSFLGQADLGIEDDADPSS